MKILRYLIGLTSLTSLSMCSMNGNRSADIAYPDPKPAMTALRFMPGIVSSDSLDFNAAFSRDGKIFYFSRTKKGKWTIMETVYDQKWSEPVRAPFSDSNYLEGDPFVANDGSIFYISNRPSINDRNPNDHDIWVVHPVGNGKFSSPENVSPVNTDSTEYYVSVADNGNLYFSSNRSGGTGQLDIYRSEFRDGRYLTPVNMGSAINSGTDEHDPYISADEQFIIFTSDRSGGFGEADLYISKHLKDGSWEKARNMGPGINTPTYDYCPAFSPDKKYFFYSAESDVKWIDAKAAMGLLK